MNKLLLVALLFFGLVLIIHKDLIIKNIMGAKIDNNVYTECINLLKNCCSECPEPSQWGYSYCIKHCDKRC